MTTPTSVLLKSTALGFAFAWLPASGAVAGSAHHDSRELLAQELRGRGVDPVAVTLPFELTEPMRRWAHEMAPPRLRPEQKLERLVTGLLDSDELDLEYAWGYTGTAAEVFERQQANCLAFTNLFLGMAREVGVPVYFMAVKDVASYRRTDDLVVVSDHVAVGYSRGLELTVYDFSEVQGEKTFDNLHKISDVTAVAMFHSNRGAEALQQGRAADAIGWLETAVELDPELANAWVNLGVVRRRAGDTAGAEHAYKRALELDPRIYSAYQNLASLLYYAGRAEEAMGYEEVLRRSPTRNPYTFLSLGDISFNSGRLEEARRFYRRAVNLSGDDAESLAALGEAAAVAGDLRTARKMLRKARKLDARNQRAARLARRLLSDA
jgi:tetratricopeptide (TPR) repeat protein